MSLLYHSNAQLSNGFLQRNTRTIRPSMAGTEKMKFSSLSSPQSKHFKLAIFKKVHPQCKYKYLYSTSYHLFYPIYSCSVPNCYFWNNRSKNDSY